MPIILQKSGGGGGKSAFQKALGTRGFDLSQEELDGVTKVRDYCFYYDNNLLSIALPNGVTEIGECAFRGCNNLTDIRIPSSITKIKNEAFEGCSSLNTTSYGNCQFLGNESNQYAVLYTSDSNISSFTMPVTYVICDKAFLDRSSLQSVQFASDLRYIGDYAFYRCSSLTSIYDSGSPSSVTKIPDWCFSQTGLTSLDSGISIFSNVQEIGGSAFSLCQSLTTLDLEGFCSGGLLTSIGDNAFSSCSSLVDITIPDSVTHIGKYAFYSSLTGNVNYNTYNDINYIGSTSNPYMVLCYPKFSTASYSISDDCKIILDRTFLNNGTVTSITIPDGVIEIGWHAFTGCSNLASVTIGAGVTSIQGNIVPGCSNSIVLSVSASNTSFYSNNNCIIETATGTVVTGADNATIPNDGTIIKIGAGAFQDGLITSVSVPSGVTSIEDDAFNHCYLMTSASLPTTLTYIGAHAFAQCSALTDIYYSGTKAQWNIIIKDWSWRQYTYGMTIHCSDGDITN